MCEELHLSLATMGQVSEELSRREHEEFILLYRSSETDEWVVNLNDKLDGMQVVEILQAFQTQMIELIRRQQAEMVLHQNADQTR